MCHTISIFCSLFQLIQLCLWDCVICWFCDIVFCVLSSFAISSLRKRELVALLQLCSCFYACLFNCPMECYVSIQDCKLKRKLESCVKSQVRI